MELKDWTMRIYVRDRRYKTGERVINTYSYKGKHEQWMHEEVRDLMGCGDWTGIFPAPKYRIEVDPVYCTVKSLMTGADVQIRYEDRVSAQDPSQERYWTL